MANDESFERPTTVSTINYYYLYTFSYLILWITWNLKHFPSILGSFASFIEGESHVKDEEILEYETTQLDFDDDDDINTDDDEDLMTDSESDKWTK